MWNLSSRVHRLHHFPSDNQCCFVKRDDELGCGISGTKLRKYASLLPFLLENKIKHLIIIAGPQSNNLLAALQVARELQLQVTACLLRPKHTRLQGNFKLSRLFLNEQNILWIERADWHKVNQIAANYAQHCAEATFVLEEGASTLPALQGAMSLADDILRNEDDLGLYFSHIFVDAGTGFSAAALIGRLSILKHNSKIHVLLLADGESVFQEKLQHWLGFNPSNYQCFYPQTAKSFGAINQTIRLEVKRLAMEEGILADPIYAAKLFHASRAYITQQKLQGNLLIIHSGGTLTMPAFDFDVN